MAEREGLVPVAAPEVEASEIIRPLILAGWIRQAAPDAYEALRDARPRVLAHVRRTYPNVSQVNLDEWNPTGTTMTSAEVPVNGRDLPRRGLPRRSRSR